MRPRRVAALVALLLTIAGAAFADAPFHGPPAITVYPDEYPTDVAFFFPAGGPLERFTARPGAWYAVYRTPMYPGRPYDLLVGHSGDPARLKVFALDNHPFGKVSVKQELRLRKYESGNGAESIYGGTISIPRDSAVYGLYLLFEWNPPPGDDRPLPVELQLLTADRGPVWGRSRPWWRSGADRGVESPLQSQGHDPYEIPVPRAGTQEKERRR
ncbi:MAG: hypothetical protein HZB86_12045 [Deltaproteobacteria bacterium]|nr:hypothetical protein [Deltaproteobacteria bacterium]